MFYYWQNSMHIQNEDIHGQTLIFFYSKYILYVVSYVEEKEKGGTLDVGCGHHGQRPNSIKF